MGKSIFRGGTKFFTPYSKSQVNKLGLTGVREFASARLRPRPRSACLAVRRSQEARARQLRCGAAKYAPLRCRRRRAFRFQWRIQWRRNPRCTLPPATGVHISVDPASRVRIVLPVILCARRVRRCSTNRDDSIVLEPSFRCSSAKHTARAKAGGQVRVPSQEGEAVPSGVSEAGGAAEHADRRRLGGWALAGSRAARAV